MIWHIFKKDARLLWWLAAGAAALQFVNTALLLQLGLFPRDQRAAVMMQLLSIGGFLATGFVIAAVVHQDAIPGVRQDWLVRPIRRRDLLLAKLLFVVLMVQLPILLANVFEGVAKGFSLGPSLEVAASRSFFLLLLVDIPFLAFASVTKNLLEAITGGVTIFFGIATLFTLIGGSRSRILRPTFGTGEEWVTETAGVALILASAAIVLALQYLHRRTRLSRWVTGAVTVAAFFVTFLPWNTAFAIEQKLSSLPGTSSGVRIDFHPEQGRLQQDFTMPPLYYGRDDVVSVYLPMRILGAPANAGIQSDHVGVRIGDPSGRTYQVEGGPLLHEANSSTNSYLPVTLPGDLYQRIRDQAVRVEIDSSLTLFSLRAAHALPAINGEQYIPGVGHCATRINNQRTAVQVRCEQAGWKPGCTFWRLESPSAGQKNPARFFCGDTDYAPYINWELMPDSIWRFGANLAFRDQAGLAKYPVDGSQLKDAIAVARVFEPVDHFSRTVVLPEVRLGSWEPDTPAR